MWRIKEGQGSRNCKLLGIKELAKAVFQGISLDKNNGHHLLR